MPVLLRSWLLGFAGAATLGCSDAPVLSPTPAPLTLPRHSAGCNPEYPCFDHPEDVPEHWTPRILHTSPVVYWDGRTAVGSSLMRYYGNRAEETFELEITGPSNARRTAQSSSNGGFFPGTYDHVTPGFTLTATAGSCGHTAQLMATHVASISIWYQAWGLASNTVSRPGSRAAFQPACPCSGGGGKGRRRAR